MKDRLEDIGFYKIAMETKSIQTLENKNRIN